jgi:ADP-ribosylglycohydrolase
MRMTLHESTRLNFATDSLIGLSVGDALGQCYFAPFNWVEDLAGGRLPEPQWQWTDDTEMACSVVWMLREHGGVDRDRLAAAFAERCVPQRGYGVGAYTILRRISEGVPWRQAAGEAFDGEGSCGNGAAMRVAPLGAYFADDPERAAAEAAASAEVTHSHPEARAGAVAVAVAASLAATARLGGERPSAGRFLAAVHAQTPETWVRRGIGEARHMITAAADEVASRLGNGGRTLAQDTVPFCIWTAARHLDDYPAAIETCIRAGGDIDTTCAIVGGIVAAFTGRTAVPAAWRDSTEPLPAWAAA